MAQQNHNLLKATTSELESACSEIAEGILDLKKVASTFSQFAQLSVDLIASKLDLYFVALFWADDANEFLEFRAGSGEYGKRILSRGHRLSIHSDINVTISTAFKKNMICLDSFDSNLFLQGFFFGTLSEDIRDNNVQPFQFIECMQYESPLLPDTGLRLFVPLRVVGKVAGILELQTVDSDNKTNIPNISLSEWGYDSAKHLLIVADQVAEFCENFDR